ncbi:MAG: thioesterase family protein [Nitriliruptoraceae bacterium]|nr:thioesterase family protein [Nitriliruptoraceae bacterium]
MEQPTSRFERDTAVARVDEHRFTATIDPGWAVIDGAAPNGGYLMALGARAMRATVPQPDPVTLTAHFLSPPEPGPIDVEVEPIRTGRRHATVGARLVQDGRERVRLLGAFGDLGTADGPDRMDRPPLTLPPVEDCVDATAQGLERSREGGFPAPPILVRFDHRWPRHLAGWAVGSPVGHGEMGGYIRWADDAPMDTLGLLVVADCYPPAVFNTGDASLGWVPTVELTVQIRKRPAPGYLATRFTTAAITRGYLEEDGEIWDADGDLVVLSRQLALASR